MLRFTFLLLLLSYYPSLYAAKRVCLANNLNDLLKKEYPNKHFKKTDKISVSTSEFDGRQENGSRIRTIINFKANEYNELTIYAERESDQCTYKVSKFFLSKEISEVSFNFSGFYPNRIICDRKNKINIIAIMTAGNGYDYNYKTTYTSVFCDGQ